MLNNNIDACIIPTGDPHCSEYLPNHYKIRQWASGFTGSAGILVVTTDNAALWTDSRYYIQAEKELKQSGILMMKDEKGVSQIHEWIADQTINKARVSINAELVAYKKFEKLRNDFNSKSLELIDYDIISQIWFDRPPLPTGKIFRIPDALSRSDRIKLLSRKLFDNRDIDTHIITSPAQICWLLNLRGSDIQYTPVFLSYMLISKTNTTLFVNINKLPKDIHDDLLLNGIDIQPYDCFIKYIQNLEKNKLKKVLIDSNTLNARLHRILKDKFSIEDDKTAPIDKLKAVKSINEIAGIKKALHKDSVSLCKLIYNLKERISNEMLTEKDISIELHDLKAKHQDFIEESFETICAYKENAAIIHYAPGNKDPKILKNEGLLLIDTGTQYLHGTTDSTRTIALGNLTDAEKFAYTIVLKSHIALACAMFPKGTTGAQLDTFAKMHYWENYMDFGHGTGHGVGFCLSVHEGPNNISPRSTFEFKEKGLVTTIEPGFYKENEFGIRLENIALTIEDDNDFLRFETLNFFPFEREAILTDILTNNEIDWLNNYHTETYNRLAPFLKEPIVQWLKEATRPII